MSRRMISQDVILSDRYLDLSDRAKSLYIILLMLADDDGVVNGHRNALRLSCADEEHFNELCESGLVGTFDDGAVCILDWLVQNKIEAKYYKRLAPEKYRSRIRVHVDGRYTLQTNESDMTIDDYRMKVSNRTKRSANRKNETKE